MDDKKRYLIIVLLVVGIIILVSVRILIKKYEEAIISWIYHDNEELSKDLARMEKYRLMLDEEEYVFNATCNMYGLGNSLRIEYVVSDSEWFVVTNGTLTWYDNGAVSCYSGGWSIVKQE